MKKALIILLTFSAALCSCKKNVRQTAINLPIVDRALYDSTSVFYGNFEDIPKTSRCSPSESSIPVRGD